MKVEIYTRFSSNNQTEHSTERQIKYCKAFAEQHDYEVVHIYTDEARSGTRDNRDEFQNMIKDGKLLVNGKKVHPSYKAKQNDNIEYTIEDNIEISLKPENIPLNIVYEDDDIIVINKQADLVVHPSFGHETGTLLNALLYHFKGKCSPFMVHRLDKDTTGEP